MPAIPLLELDALTLPNALKLFPAGPLGCLPHPAITTSSTVVTSMAWVTPPTVNRVVHGVPVSPDVDVIPSKVTPLSSRTPSSARSHASAQTAGAGSEPSPR